MSEVTELHAAIKAAQEAASQSAGFGVLAVDLLGQVEAEQQAIIAQARELAERQQGLSDLIARHVAAVALTADQTNQSLGIVGAAVTGEDGSRNSAAHNAYVGLISLGSQLDEHLRTMLPVQADVDERTGHLGQVVEQQETEAAHVQAAREALGGWQGGVAAASQELDAYRSVL